MKKTIVLAVVLAFVSFYATPVLAMHETMDNIKEGLTDIVKSPLELHKHITDEYHAASFKPFGIVGGFLKGAFYTLYKLSSGVVGVVTSPLHLGE